MTRREQLFPEITRLREEEGLVWREIAERLGIGKSTAKEYYHDPTGEKTRKRKERYASHCEICGGLTNGSNGLKHQATTCGLCNTHTPESVLLVIQDWADEHGGVPPTSAEVAGIAKAVTRFFGSWNQALLAAGYELRCDRRPETQAEMERLIKEGRSVHEVADHFGWTEHNVHMRLKTRGLTVSGVRGYRLVPGPPDPEKIREAQALRAQGLPYRRVAEKFGVAYSTAYRWINSYGIAA